MMSTGRGNEAGVLEGLIAFGKDPKAMAGRLEQLKAAQDAADERIVKAAEVEVANAKRVDELDALMAELDKRKVALDGREAAIAKAEGSLISRNNVLQQNIDLLKGQQVQFDERQKQAKSEAATIAASIKVDREELDARDRAIGQRETEIEDIQRDLMKRSEALAARESAFASRQEALKQALAGV